MKVIELEYKSLPVLTDEYVTAIGFFDGMHKGHLSLIEEVKRVSKEKNLKSAVMTFDQHPLVVLKGEERKYLTSPNDRIRILEEEGIDTLFVIKFSKEVASLCPEEFIQDFVDNLNIRHVVVGFDFRFGNKNSGTAESFKNHGFGVSVVEAVMFDEERKVSSTLIKEMLLAGHVRDVNEMLTRDYCITGQVVHGKARGREFGFPTANVDIGNYCYLKKGVYGVIVDIKGKQYKGMANIGVNPTFDDIFDMTLEVNIFDFDEDIYDEIISVHFKFFEREEVKLNSIDELIDLMHKDQDYVKKHL